MAKTLESVGTHYSPAAWRSEEGGYVGHANWRDEHQMGTTTYCGHKHRLEGDARQCIEGKLQAHKRGEHDGVRDPRCGWCWR